MIGEGNSSVHRTGNEESSSSSKNAANLDLVLSMMLGVVLQNTIIAPHEGFEVENRWQASESQLLVYFARCSHN